MTHRLTQTPDDVEWLEDDEEPVAIGKGMLSNLAQQVLSWLTGKGVQAAIQNAVQQVLSNLYAEAFAVGKESALEQLGNGYNSNFWDKWTPGDTSAARLVAGPGLQDLLDQYGIATIKSVANTRMNDLANALAEGFEDGDSPDQIASSIRQILIKPQRAQMIAGTELARATTMASVGEYRKANQDAKEWSTAHDDRVCKEHCKPNSEAGLVPMDQPFPDTGDTFPPAHPECRCALLPGELPAEVSGVTPYPLTAVKGVHTALMDEYRESGLSVLDFCQDYPQFMPVSGEFKNSIPRYKASDVVAGGLAVRAKDTGRVLMIQRAHDEDDPAGGKWEFPGGRLDDGETPEDAARREWGEETGLTIPDRATPVQATWEAGPYRGHVVGVDRESDLPLLDREKGANPDDPDNDQFEALAWWDPAELKDNPAVREELQEHPKRVRRALEAAGQPVNKGVLASMATSLAVSPQTVYDQLLQNYPPESIEWVKRATWHGPYLISWDKVDHDDMDKWAASHQPERVDHFARKIEAGEDVKPVVLVADPDGNYIDVDGHHRALAYHKLDRPVRAWVGQIQPADRHAMEETHLDQEHEGADPKNE